MSADETGLDAVDPSTHRAYSGEPFRRILAAREAVEAAEAELVAAVRHAREADYPWVMVGAALDVTKETAAKRFGD